MLKKIQKNIYYSSGVINHKIRILALAKSYEKIVSGILIRNIYSKLGIINNFLSKQIYRLNCISEIRVRNIYSKLGIINNFLSEQIYRLNCISEIRVRNIYSQLGIINNFLSKQIYRLNCISEIRGGSK